MRAVPIAALVLLSGCATAAPAGPERLSATPGGIELTAWCTTQACENRQQVADAAEAHCRQGGRAARLATSYVVERSAMLTQEKWYYRFDCVR